MKTKKILSSFSIKEYSGRRNHVVRLIELFHDGSFSYIVEYKYTSMDKFDVRSFVDKSYALLYYQQRVNYFMLYLVRVIPGAEKAFCM